MTLAHGLSTLLPLLAAVFLALAVWDVESDTWVATDALGRALPGRAECGPPRADRSVGVFYFGWLGEHSELQDDIGPYDIRKIVAANPDDPAFGPIGQFHHWGEPELGYYIARDEYVLRKHAQMLSDAGINVLALDITNGHAYEDVYLLLLANLHSIRAQGGLTPQVTFLANTNAPQTVLKVYEYLYSKGRYRDLWFRWMGKPLMMASPEGMDPALADFFTFRQSWAWTTPDSWFGDGRDKWPWVDTFPQGWGWHTPGVPEELPVAVATHPVTWPGSPETPMGRSFCKGRQPALGRCDLCPSSGEGLFFSEQWSRLEQVDPRFIFICGWNEWVAVRLAGGVESFLGKPLAPGQTFFFDQYNQEFSRDIEPMKGGHTDNYYYQMISGIRKYKGVRSPMGPGLPKTIAIEGDFSDWEDVTPEYRDTMGDTEPRHSIGWGSAGPYINNTGRNDFIRAKVARDSKYVYFYAQTRDNITPYTDPYWMMLFIDSDRDHSTGWHGYDYLVNFPPIDSTTTTVKRTESGWNWKQVGTAQYRVSGNEIAIAIPRALLGLSADSSVRLDFHWADNIQKPDDITEFFVSGDSAPNRRFNYRYDSEGPGPPWEFAIDGDTEEWAGSGSIADLRVKRSSLCGDITGADPQLTRPRPPDFSADMYRYIKIRMKIDSGAVAAFYWGTPAELSHSADRVVSFPITADNEFHEYLVDMTASPAWNGTVNSLRFDPSEDATSGHFEIDYVRFVRHQIPDESA